MMIVELFFNECYADFYWILSGNEKLSKKVQSSQKYQGDVQRYMYVIITKGL